MPDLQPIKPRLETEMDAAIDSLYGIAERVQDRYQCDAEGLKKKPAQSEPPAD